MTPTLNDAPANDALLTGATLREPSLRELVARSSRIGAVPGLAEQVAGWQLDLPEVRRRLDREARALATARLWTDTVGALAQTAWNVVATAAPQAPLALLTAAAASAGVPIAPPDASGRTIEAAQRLVRAGGPAYVKLGQFIASSDGLLPHDWVAAFAWCRDSAPTLRPGVAESILRRELGEEVVRDLDPEPLAAGSIGQVHTARLADGRAVAVKIRRPRLRARFRRDIETLALVAAGAHRLIPALQAANLPAFVQLFAQLSLSELDFRLEALNAAESAAVLEDAGLSEVAVPLPLPGLVTERVLVMPFVDGVTYDRALAVHGADLDGDRLLRLAIRAVLETTLVYGVSHGDLHAGNVLIPRPGHVNLLDFGICARLDARQRASLVRFLVAFAGADAAGQVDALADFGAFPPSARQSPLIGRLQDELDRLNARAGGEITYDKLGVTLSRLLQAMAANGFTMPKELVLFFKNLMYLGSFAAGVAPRTDLFDAITTVIGELDAAHPELFG